MLHELLLSLLGKPGAVIQQRGDTFEVDPSLTFLSTSESDVINKIAPAGYYYAQINQFVNVQLVETSFADIKKEPSVYRKAIAQGLRLAMQPYQALILGIQSDYLRSKYFTFSGVMAQTMRYQTTMREVWALVSKILTQKYRGGVVIDILSEVYRGGNQWLRQWIKLLLRECQGVFMSQVVAWVAHGQIIDSEGEFFIHKTISEPEDKYRIGKDKIEMTNWDIYTVDQDLLPQSLLSRATAGKILFIGKSVKILLKAGRVSAIPGRQLLSDLKQICTGEYSQIKFQGIIQKIRREVAREMIKLIVGQENLIRELQRINSYYLMLKGDFYHHFLEESKCVQAIAVKQRQQRKINQTCLPNTFMRLGSLQDARRVSFQIKPLGFQYLGFKNFVGVCPVGNIDLVQNKFIRFSASGGALWHRNKQIVENNFTVSFSLRFKKLPSVFKTRREENQLRTNSVSLVIQNSKDISPSAHDNPAGLAAIEEYLAINVGFRYSDKEHNYQSVLEVGYRNSKKYTKEVCLQSFTPKRVNFLDENIYLVKIGYAGDQLKIGVGAMGSGEEQIIKIDAIRLSNYLNLQMSRANVGFISRITDFNCRAQIEKWEMICKPANYYGDVWSDFVLNLKMEWPIDLILTPDLIQIFSRINKFLFPIRQTQIELEQLWAKLPRRFKQYRLQSRNGQNKDIAVFERKVCALCWRMGLTAGALWSYCEADVVQTAWVKLKQKITSCNDFEEVIRMIAKYVNTIQTMFYFNALKIQRCIHEIIRQSKLFLGFAHKLSTEVIDQRTFKEFQNIDDSFKRATSEFLRLLRELCKGSNYNYLFYLTQRIEGCVQQDRSYYIN